MSISADHVRIQELKKKKKEKGDLVTQEPVRLHCSYRSFQNEQDRKVDRLSERWGRGSELLTPHLPHCTQVSPPIPHPETRLWALAWPTCPGSPISEPVNRAGEANCHQAGHCHGRQGCGSPGPGPIPGPTMREADLPTGLHSGTGHPRSDADPALHACFELGFAFFPSHSL